jgi:hypothetical protein
MKKKSKLLYIVYWYNATGYTEYVEAYTNELAAQLACDKYQSTHKDITYATDYIELIK